MKEGEAPEELREERPEKPKRAPKFRPAELIALALAAVFIAAAAYLAVHRFTGAELVFAPASSTPKTIETDWIVNINTADAKELMTLDGIGETLAGRIIDYRDEHGDFASVQDIVNVSGISQKTFEQIAAHITV